jgi:peroxiredoxin
VNIQFKSAPIEDTATFSGKVHFFKKLEDPYELAHFVCSGQGNLICAYDGNFFYSFDHQKKIIRLTASTEYNPNELMKNGLFLNLSLFRPYLKTTSPAFSLEQYDGYVAKKSKTPDSETIQLKYAISYLNDFKLSPIDPDSGRHIVQYDISLADYSLRSITDWHYFLPTPQYQRVEFSPIRPLPEDSTLNSIVGWVSLIDQGYRMEYYNPDADTAAIPEIKTLAEGDIFPDFNLPDLDGTNIRSDMLKDGLLLIDFWHRACAPCLMAMPGIENLHQRFGAKGLTVLGINPYDTDATKLKSFMGSREFTYRVLLDQERLLPEQVGIDTYPTLLLVDAASKNILHIQTGFSEDDEAALDKLIRSYLEK